MRAKLSAALAALFIALSPPAHADALQDALDLWLKGDDAGAIPALAALAHGGDPQAVLFLVALGPLATRGDWNAALTDAERAALRPPAQGGWTYALPQGRLRDISRALDDTRPDALLRLGQPFAAIPAMPDLTLLRNGELARLHLRHPLPEAVTVLVLQDAAKALASGRDMTVAEADGMRALLAGPALAAIGPGMQRAMLDGAMAREVTTVATATGVILFEGSLDGLPPQIPVRLTEAERATATEGALALLLVADEAAGARSLCRDICPDAPAACVGQVWAVAGGYRMAVRHQTPLDLVMPADRYRGSPRHALDLRRSIAGNLQRVPDLMACVRAATGPDFRPPAAPERRPPRLGHGFFP
jgi:hypothetical protein